MGKCDSLTRPLTVDDFSSLLDYINAPQFAQFILVDETLAPQWEQYRTKTSLVTVSLSTITGSL